jgi:hypothetical protein
MKVLVQPKKWWMAHRAGVEVVKQTHIVEDEMSGLPKVIQECDSFDI